MIEILFEVFSTTIQQCQLPLLFLRIFYQSKLKPKKTFNTVFLCARCVCLLRTGRRYATLEGAITRGCNLTQFPPQSDYTDTESTNPTQR